MKIIGFKLHLTQVPFTISFNHNTKSRTEAEAVMLEVYTECGVVGYGETLAREYVTGETNTSVVTHAVGTILPSLIHAEFVCCGDLIIWLEYFHKHYPQINEKEQCIKALVELALLDAYGKSVNEPIIELIGGRFRPELIYSGVISTGKSAHVDRYIQAYKALGISEYKVKVGSNWQDDLHNIARVRELCGKDVSIRVDANEAWDLPTASRCLEQLAGLGVISCEQPMPAALRDDYPKLVRNVGDAIKICIDESLCSLADAYWFLEKRGAQIFNLRVAKNGGILGALALGRAAIASGVDCQLGSQVGETSILTRAGQIVASCTPAPLIHHEGAFGTMLLAYDLTPNPIMFGAGGVLNASGHSLPGLGVDVDRRALGNMIHQTVWQSSAELQILAH